MVVPVLLHHRLDGLARGEAHDVDAAGSPWGFTRRPAMSKVCAPSGTMIELPSTRTLPASWSAPTPLMPVTSGLNLIW